jgi:hypothetical protein
VRLNRQTFGVIMLAASIGYSALALTPQFHPMSLRMRAHGGVERMAALVLGSLSFKAGLLIVAAILAFWPTKTS